VLRLETVFFIGHFVVEWYFVIKEATHFQLLFAVTPRPKCFSPVFVRKLYEVVLAGFYTQAVRYFIILRSAHVLYFSVPYGSVSKQRMFPQTALTGWAL
jgi:hypothetical protein